MTTTPRKLGSTSGRWSDSEISFVRDNFRTMTNLEMATKLGRTPNGVGTVMHNNDMRRCPGPAWTRWSEEEKAYLREKYGTVPASEIAAELGRTEATIRSNAGHLGLTDPDYNNRKRWTPEEDAIVIENQFVEPKELARLLPGRSVTSIQHRIFRLRFPEKRVHRYVVEKALGRKLSTDEHIHHINMDHTDNSVENLALLTNRDHQLAHGSINLVVKELIQNNIIKFNGHTKRYEIV